MRHGLAVILLVLTTASAVFAHGGGEHLKGTVASVAADAIVVDDEHGQAHRVQLDANTRFRDVAGATAKASDLRAGDRVVVHLGVEAKRTTAVEVRFGHSEAKSKDH
jgi:hypothetical protein